MVVIVLLALMVVVMLVVLVVLKMVTDAAHGSNDNGLDRLELVMVIAL